MAGRKTRVRISQPMVVNITSLMDIMTTLLFFLLVNFASEEQKVDPPKDFVLPASTSERNVKLAVKVSLSLGELRVEERKVMQLAAGKVRASDIDASQHVAPLLRELRREKVRLQSGSRAESGGEEDDDEIVYFEAERGIVFETIDRVMKTAAAAGFTKFRLAVHRKV
ncbi:MAG: biopolymer transporter ExbD [Deltaproteobacteria bacterium]|nr:biopolymer transporter ExbD [Deltaproteobacteria bacterium]